MKITNDKLIEKTCRISNTILRLKFGKDYDKKCIVINDDDTTQYTETAQDIFNNIYDQVENLILEYVEIKEDK